MSHRDLNEILALRSRLETLDIRIAAAKRWPVVDLMIIADLKRRREEMAAHLARFEEANP